MGFNVQAPPDAMMDCNSSRCASTGGIQQKKSCRVASSHQRIGAQRLERPRSFLLVHY